MNIAGRLIIVSNRLPVTIERGQHGLEIRPSTGGLVSALFPIFKGRGGSWVGWPGSDYDGEIESVMRAQGASDYCFEPVFLTQAEKAHFYDGCCNEIIWPLFHDLQSYCNFDPVHWSAYRTVNDKFADSVERVVNKRDLVWVHDYHLMLLADRLRLRGVRCKLAYFHHIPFPSPDVFEKLPWRVEVLSALLRFNMLGFQTDRDRRNFVSCLRRCFSDLRIKRTNGKLLVNMENQFAEIGTFPISIDFAGFATESLNPDVAVKAAEIRRSIAGGQIILGIDRLDYTKGIPERLAAFRTLLESNPELRGRVTLVQLVVPSREEIPAYRDCKMTIERLVSEINGQYGNASWSPVLYLYRHASGSELLAFYRAAHVALVTPLRDGMNLVAKEFCAARCDEQGVLMLSEFAGSAVELKNGALLVNPHDAQGVASALYRALTMPESEQGTRMRRMRQVIKRNDVFQWCRALCGQTVLHAAPQNCPAPSPREVVAIAEAV